MLELLITNLKKRTEYNPTAAKQTGTYCYDTPDCSDQTKEENNKKQITA